MFLLAAILCLVGVTSPLPTPLPKLTSLPLYVYTVPGAVLHANVPIVDKLLVIPEAPTLPPLHPENNESQEFKLKLEDDDNNKGGFAPTEDKNGSNQSKQEKYEEQKQENFETDEPKIEDVKPQYSYEPEEDKQNNDEFLIVVPEIPTLPSFEVFEPGENKESESSQDELQSHKEFELPNDAKLEISKLPVVSNLLSNLPSFPSFSFPNFQLPSSLPIQIPSLPSSFPIQLPSLPSNFPFHLPNFSSIFTRPAAESPAVTVSLSPKARLHPTYYVYPENFRYVYV